VAALRRERDGAGPALVDLGPSDPGGPGRFDPSGLELRLGDALAGSCRSPGRLGGHDRHGPAVQRPAPHDDGRREAGEAHANRRTDYAMLSEDPADLANAADYPAFLDGMTEILGQLHRVLRPGRYAVLIVRDAYQDGRYLFTASDLAPSAPRRRAGAQG
jgi:hypothetical protein